MNAAFSGTPFIAGSIFGERSWTVRTGNMWSNTPALMSPSFQCRWDPGEMSATCRASLNTKLLRAGQALSNRMDFLQRYVPEGARAVEYDQVVTLSGSLRPEYMIHWRRSLDPNPTAHTSGRVLVTEAELLRDLNELPHEVKDCTCGFYAYFDPAANEYASPQRVTGVIEGFGETWIGTRGFRCQKSRIVAVALPEQDTHRYESNMAVWMSRYDSPGEVRDRWPRLKKIAKRYGVPYFPTVEAMKAEFPVTKLEEVIS